MTKKDYILIANVFEKFTNFENANNRHPLDYTKELILSLANALQQQNPKFDRHRFLTACGIEQPEPIN